jgi:hypothetical protein
LGATDYEEQRDELAMRLREQLVHSGLLLAMQLENALDAKFEDHLASEEFGRLFFHAMPLS